MHNSNFLLATYLLALLGLYFGMVGWSKSMTGRFADLVYGQIQKPKQGFVATMLQGLLAGLLLARLHKVHVFLQGALHVKQISWHRAVVFLLAAGAASALILLMVVQLLPLQWLQASVVVCCFGVFATFVFRSDLYRLHGQHLFYGGISLLAFAWISHVHQYMASDAASAPLWFWINSHVVFVFVLAVFMAVAMRTHLVLAVVALSLLHLELVTFEVATALFWGSYIGAPLGSMLIYMQVGRQGLGLAVLHIVGRAVLVLLAAVSMGVWAQSMLLMFVEPTTLLVLLCLGFDLLLLLLFAIIGNRLKDMLALGATRLEQSTVDPYQLFAKQPTLCFEMARSFVLEMGQTVRQMMRLLCDPFVENSREAMIAIDEQYDLVEQRARQINFYLAKINVQELSYVQSQRETHWLQMTDGLKNISSFISRNIMDIASTVKERGSSFEPGSWDRLRDCHERLLENFDRMLENIAQENPETLKVILRNQKQIHSLKEEIKQAYLQKMRLDENISIEGAAAFLSLLSQLQFLNISISRLAYPAVDRRALSR